VQVKARVMAATGWPDNAATHLATALVTGVVSTTVTNPVDVVKTFMFVGEHRTASLTHLAQVPRV
jgi:solute carrier family 25 uncoupling protein 8/9